MKKFLAWLLLSIWLVPAATLAEQQPAAGKLLVATELVQGDFFYQTVVLLLHYDETGAVGIVINRPTEVDAEEVLAEIDVAPDYRGTLFWGGPVQISALRALVRTNSPPAEVQWVVDSVYEVPIDDWLGEVHGDPRNLRFFIGYAGWGPAQLDGEMARGSWHVVPATAEDVFADDPQDLWERLQRPRQIRTRLSDDAIKPDESSG